MIMDRMSFIESNNINDYEYFVNNYEAIMTSYGVCTLFNDFNMKNINIVDNSIYFELKKKVKSIPIINSSSVYDKKYQVDLNINNDTVGIIMKEVSGV